RATAYSRRATTARPRLRFAWRPPGCAAANRVDDGAPTLRPFGGRRGGAERATKLLMRFVRVAAFLGLCACASPTLPLPPPSIRSVAQVSPGKFKLSSERGAEPDALIVIYNHNPSVSLAERVDGAQADSERTWEETITAFPGDVIDVSQEFGSTRSPQTTFQIPKP